VLSFEWVANAWCQANIEALPLASSGWCPLWVKLILREREREERAERVGERERDSCAWCPLQRERERERRDEWERVGGREGETETDTFK